MDSSNGVKDKVESCVLNKMRLLELYWLPDKKIR